MFVHKDSGQSRKRKIKNFGLVSDLILRGMDKRTKSGHVKFTKSDTCADLIIRLAKKDLDAIFCDYDAVKYLLKNSALEGEIIFNPDLPLIDNYWYVSTVSHKAIIQDLNLWVNNNRRFLENMLHAH
ncbi:MAG: hypothetical protein EB127_22720 [Alphaproteobacteria bacterium]|nr:hypothetical protein [Alphaproteobacteria bacterium]